MDMYTWNTAAVVLAYSIFVLAQIMCPNDSLLFYYSDAPTGYKVFHYYDKGGELKNLVCPFGKTFHSLSSTLKPVETAEGSAYGDPTPVNLIRKARFGQNSSTCDWPFNYPSVKSFFKEANKVISGDTVTEKIVLPTVFEMMANPASNDDLIKIFISARYAFISVRSEVVKQQLAPLPTHTIKRALYVLLNENKHALVRLISRHRTGIKARILDNFHVIFDDIVALRAARYPHSKELMCSTLNFVAKYKYLWLNDSAAEQISSTAEIIHDLLPVQKAFFKVAIEYLRHRPFWIANLLYRREELIAPTPVEVSARLNHPFRLAVRKLFNIPKMSIVNNVVVV